MKRLLLAVTVLMLSILLIACGSSTPDTKDFECEFDKETNTAKIVGYNGNEKSVTIPEKLGRYTVTEIGRAAFSEEYDISEIIIPETVKSIGASAFELCISIKTIELPKNLEKLGNAAFTSCRGLQSIYIPETVTDIGICVFTGCTALEEIEVADTNPNYSSDRYGALLNEDQTVLIQFPLGCQRPSYEMPDTVEAIESYAFEKADYVESITFSPNLKTIGSYAFQSSAIRSASLGSKLESIGSFAFNESKLKEIELGNSLKTIGDAAFSWCTSLSTVSLPDSVESIGSSAFYMCTSVEKYSVGESNKAFCSDEAGVLFDKDMTTLLYYPVARTAEEYTVPDSVNTISSRAFSPCLPLSKVIIPNSVESIGEEAFAQCANLTSVTINDTPPQSCSKTAFDEKVVFTYLDNSDDLADHQALIKSFEESIGR